jgi:single-stranded-DNA-specific exonuclease
MTNSLSLLGKRWHFTGADEVAAKKLQSDLNISPIIASLLVSRGLHDPVLARKFLNPSLDDLGKPELLPDYRAAVDEILAAKESGELIYVHGDYDVDGVTSSAIFDRFLKKIGCNVHTHVPHRILEGYGVNIDAVRDAHAKGAKLFLTCDCGIAAHEMVTLARELGMRVVVTDHHELKDTMPEAQAVVNPHRNDSKYPFSELSGAGVVFRLCEGITREVFGEKVVNAYRKNYLEFAALGTIADVMPLIGENRIIAKFGLECLTTSKRQGIIALKSVAEVAGAVTSYDVGFKFGPRLNAAGRIDDAALSLRLLLTDDADEAMSLALELDRHNTDRRLLQDRIMEEALLQAEKEGAPDRYVVMVFNKEWHPGVIGIVAGKLKEHYSRPAFVGTIDPETGSAKASGRSIPGINLAQMIGAFPGIVSGGGHAMAAGIHFRADALKEVNNAFDLFAQQVVTMDDFVPSVEVAVLVDGHHVDMRLVEELQMLEPFGAANPKPVFSTNTLTIKGLRAMGNARNHAEISLESGNGQRIRGIAWGMFSVAESLSIGELIDVVFEPQINEFRGQKSLQWRIVDFRQAALAGYQQKLSD